MALYDVEYLIDGNAELADRFIRTNAGHGADRVAQFPAGRGICPFRGPAYWKSGKGLLVADLNFSRPAPQIKASKGIELMYATGV